MLSFFRNLVVPNSKNRYRAWLISAPALSVYTVILIVTNIFFSGAAIQPAAATLDINQIIQLHNQQREQHGMDPLTFNPVLAQSAQLKGEAMLESDCWSHYCPPGTSPWEFYKQVDYRYTYAGENLAEGFSDSSVVMQAWMNSKTHRENVLKTQFTEIGIAIVYGKFQGVRNNAVVVVHFGTPASYRDLVTTEGELDADSEKEFGITSPRPESHISDNTPQISGRSSDDLEVRVGTERSGRIIPDGGIFNYSSETELEDGEHVATASQLEQDLTDSSRFTVDTEKPEIDKQQLAVTAKYQEKQTTSAMFTYESEEELTAFTIQTEEAEYYGTATTTPNQFNIKVPVEELGEDTKLVAIDKAGNKTEQKISTTVSRLLTEINNQELIELTGERGGGILAALSNFQFGSARSIVALGLIVLLALFGLDMLYLRYKFKNLELEQQKSQVGLHMAAFSLLLLVILIGNFSGSV